MVVNRILTEIEGEGVHDNATTYRATRANFQNMSRTPEAPSVGPSPGFGHLAPIYGNSTKQTTKYMNEWLTTNFWRIDTNGREIISSFVYTRLEPPDSHSPVHA